MKFIVKLSCLRGLILVMLFSALTLDAQKVLLQGSAEKLIVDTRLMKQYEFEVLQDAINNALYKQFGSSVTSNYEDLNETSMSGRSVISHSELRNNYISSFPNGVWRETKGEPTYDTYKDQKGNWWLKCTVTGWGEEIRSQPVKFTALTLDGPDLKNESVQFYNGESGYFYFKSAEDGYLMIFLDDFKNVQRCLPYNGMKETCLPVKANENYLFFSPDSSSNYTSNKAIVDELEYYTDKDLEFNLYYVLFSKSPINAPEVKNEKQLPDNYTTFKTINRSDFQKWLQQNRLRNPDLEVKIIGVTIKSLNFN